MTKYSKEEKVAALKAVEAGESIAEIARQSQINDSVLEWIVRNYREHGEKGFHTHAYNWTAEQKYRVLKYKQENQLSFRETGIEFGTSDSTIYQWEQRYLKNGIKDWKTRKRVEPWHQAQTTQDQGRRTAGQNSRLGNREWISKKIECLGCRAGKTRKREQVAVISELRQKYPLKKLLITARIPRSSYYYHWHLRVSPRSISKSEKWSGKFAWRIKVDMVIGGSRLHWGDRDSRSITNWWWDSWNRSISPVC